MCIWRGIATPCHLPLHSPMEVLSTHPGLAYAAFGWEKESSQPQLLAFPGISFRRLKSLVCLSGKWISNLGGVCQGHAEGLLTRRLVLAESF